MGINLALISQDFPPEIGGIETYATELAARFAKQCDEFLVIAPDKAHAGEVDQSLPYDVYRIASSNPFLGIKSMVDAPVLLRKKKVTNVFHTQWQTLPVSLFARRLGIVGNIFAAAHGRELLFNPFESVPLLGRWHDNYKQYFMSQVDLFFPVSEYTADLLIDHGMEKNRVKVVLNGTDPSRFYPTNTEAARKSINVDAQKVVLTITRLVSRKGVDTTLKAFQRVLSSHPDSCYIVVGDGQQKKQLQELAARLNIQDSVHFVGRVPHSELIHYYNACDVFVLPSKTAPPNIEGFGLVFLEANACEKPVIGTFSAGIPSAVVNGETGILVEEQNSNALAEAIDCLLADKNLAVALGKKGRKRVEQETNWDMTAQKILDLMTDKI